MDTGDKLACFKIIAVREREKKKENNRKKNHQFMEFKNLTV